MFILNTVTIVQALSPVTSTSMLSSSADCPGTSTSEDTIRIVNKTISDCNARFGNLGIDKILVKLMERPTKMRPTRAAEAATSAAKKVSQLVICISLYHNTDT